MQVVVTQISCQREGGDGGRQASGLQLSAATKARAWRANGVRRPKNGWEAAAAGTAEKSLGRC